MRNWYTSPLNMKHKIWVIGELLLVFILLSMPGNQFPKTEGWWIHLPIDKFIHVLLFGSLAYSIFNYFNQAPNAFLKTIRAKAIALLFCVIYGIAMEFYQKYFVPSRGFEVNDMLADAFGAIIALPLFNKLQLRKQL